MSHELRYPLFHGYVDRWLVSGVRETPVYSEPVALHGAENEKINGYPKDKPGQEAFVAARRAAPVSFPARMDPRPGGLVGNEGETTPFSVYWPFDDIGVTYAWDCETPACLSAWACTELWADRDGSAPFELITCGSAALWVNGEKITEMTPYNHNTPTPVPVSLPLRSGRNTVLVFFDNYAERDATIILRLRSSDRAKDSMRVPCRSAPASVKAARLPPSAVPYSARISACRSRSAISRFQATSR